MTKVLYVTYNGLTDHIGTAQVLPYLQSCAEIGHDISVISFEKKSNSSAVRLLDGELREFGIDWHPLNFYQPSTALTKLVETLRLRYTARKILRANRFDLIHCRSYVPATTCLSLKKAFKIPLVFDMRGLWADQRKEGNRWDQRKIIYRFVYKYWKRQEKAIIRETDEIVSLTKECASEIESWPEYGGNPITICPCNVDTSTFRPILGSQRQRLRKDLGLRPHDPLVVYLGSIGSVYLLKESIQLFSKIHERHPNARFMFIGFHSVDALTNICREAQVSLPPSVFITKQLGREDVPMFLGAADLGLCLIMPSYSSIGVSPTKLGEFLACGLPIIGNTGIGDIENLASTLPQLTILANFSDHTMTEVAKAYRVLSDSEREEAANRAQPLVDIKQVIARYDRIYRKYEYRHE
ncbi:MAG: glycosyltransferase [Pseudomonadota bacterium]